MAQSRLLLFDIDGTLVHSPTKAGRNAFELAIFRITGIPDALSGITLHGNTDLIIIKDAWTALKLPQPSATQATMILNEYVSCLKSACDQGDAMKIIPGVTDFLKRAKKETPLLGLATGNIEAGAELKLQCVGLWQEFAFGGYGSDAETRAELINVAIKRANKLIGADIPHRSIWIIGDTPKDIIAAKQAKVRSIAVATGIYSREVLEAESPDLCCNNLTEIDPAAL